MSTAENKKDDKKQDKEKKDKEMADLLPEEELVSKFKIQIG